MKNINLLILLTLILISCSSKSDLILIGNINNKVNGKIVLTKKGNILEGTFFDLDKEKEIKLVGTIVNNKINLQEFEKENKLSGFFEGSLNKSVYKGMWLNVDKTKKVPFHFILKNNANVNSKIEKFDVENKNISGLQKAYSKWYIRKTGVDNEFYKEEECYPHEEYGGAWMVDREGLVKYGTLSEKINFVTGNINNDKFIDAIANIESPVCGGSRSFAICLIFISNTKGEYDIYYNSNLKFKYETELDTIVNHTIKGKYYEHGFQNNHRTAETPLTIEYKNGGFNFNYGKIKYTKDYLEYMKNE